MNNNLNFNMQGLQNNQNVQDLQSMQNINNIQGNQVVHRKIVRRDRKRRFTRNKKSLILLGVTAIALVVATYAWFVGLRRVQVEQFEVEVVTTEGLSLSLDGKHWGTTIRVNEGIINGDTNMWVDGDTGDKIIGTGGTYLPSSGNVNHWADAGNTVNKKGLEPVSSAGELYYNSSENNTKNSQLRFFSKTALSSEKNGYKVLAEEVTGPNTKGYVSFDLFLKNSTGATYDHAYISQNDESLFLTKGSYVNYSAGGSAAGHGIENSVRVGFYALGRVDAATDNTTAAGLSVIQGITCQASENVTSLCNIGQNGVATNDPVRGDNWNIWEPNDIKHREESITRYDSACIRRDSNGKFFGDNEYAGTNTKNCDAFNVDTNTYVGDIDTYAIKNDILLSSAVDSNIYDGHNDYTNPNMLNVDTLTDTVNRDQENRTALLHIAPSSITKIRVYIWLEGQDIDNFDLAAEYQTLKVLFGLTKERYDPTDLPSTTSDATTTE